MLCLKEGRETLCCNQAEYFPTGNSSQPPYPIIYFLYGWPFTTLLSFTFHLNLTHCPIFHSLKLLRESLPDETCNTRVYCDLDCYHPPSCCLLFRAMV
jgi:hypothetical protein